MYLAGKATEAATRMASGLHVNADGRALSISEASMIPPLSNGDGVLYLNMGDRNAQRGIAERRRGNEIYMIEHVGRRCEFQNGETIRVKFSGREKIYRGVTSEIVGIRQASAIDHIYVAEGVTSDVEFHGGAATTSSSTTVPATLLEMYGGPDRDYIQFGPNSATGAYLCTVTATSVTMTSSTTVTWSGRSTRGGRELRPDLRQPLPGL